MTDKDEMRKTVEEIWQEKIYNFDYGNGDKIRIIDSGTDDAVAILMSKINFQSTDNLESQINDIVLDPSNWNLSVKALIANPVFSDLVALSFTGRVLTGDPLGDESYADEGEYISQFRESLKRLNLNWMDYASQSIDSILLNDARYVLDHWSNDRDVSFLIEDCFEANDVLDYEQLNKDFYYRYCDMVRDRVKQVITDPVIIIDDEPVDLTQYVINKLKDKLCLHPMTMDFFETLLDISSSDYCINKTFEKAQEDYEAAKREYTKAKRSLAEAKEEYFYANDEYDRVRCFQNLDRYVEDFTFRFVCDLEFEGKRLSWDQQRKLATMLKTSVKAIVEGYLNK